MQSQVGIPQAMLFHEFGRFWTSFFENLGITVTLSGETTKQLLDRGTALAIDESCLPLKIYLGHVESLLDKCSYIFVPHITQYHRNFFFCAKFAGLPDIVRNTFGLPPTRLICPNADSPSFAGRWQAIHTICRALGLPTWRGSRAYYQALSTIHNESSREDPLISSQSVAVIGHSYLLQDAFFCQNIINTLQAGGFNVITPNQLPAKTLYREAQAFAPDIYWQLSAKIAGAVRYCCRHPAIAGVAVVSSFSCGPNSLLNEYIEHHVLQASNKPYIILNLDEHTGSAGIVTRIEAFVDLVKWRLRS